MYKNVQKSTIQKYKNVQKCTQRYFIEAIRGCWWPLEVIGGHLEGNNRTCTFIRYLRVLQFT